MKLTQEQALRLCAVMQTLTSALRGAVAALVAQLRATAAMLRRWRPAAGTIRARRVVAG